MEFDVIAVLIGLGLLNGVIAGLLGVGGGLIIVPAMLWFLPKVGVSQEQVMHMALATSMATICFTSISSARAHQKRGSIATSAFKVLAPTISIGALLGAWLVGFLNTLVLAWIFGVFCILMGIKFLLNRKNKEVNSEEPLQLNSLETAPVGTGMGILSSLVGIGGGSLVVPYLLHKQYSMVKSVGTAAACGLPLAILSTVGYIATGWNEEGLPQYHFGYVYIPAMIAMAVGAVLTAPFGAYLAHKLPVILIKRFFAVFLMVVGVNIILKHL